MSFPIYQIDQVIECDAIVGWVKEVYVSTTDPTKYVYGVEEPESEAIFLFTEEELSPKTP